MDIPIQDGGKTTIKIKKTHFGCSKCAKTFRNEDKYDEHMKKQLCIKKEDRTYCEVCNICLPNKKKFIKHKITPLHYMNITRMDVEEFEVPNNEKVEADPYLNKNDCKKMKQTCGEGISICFNNSDLLDIQFDVEEEEEEEEQEEQEQEEEEEQEEQEEQEQEEQEQEQEEAEAGSRSRSVCLTGWLAALSHQTFSAPRSSFESSWLRME